MPPAVSHVFASPFALSALRGSRIVESFLLMSKDVRGQGDICQHFTVHPCFIPHRINEQLFINKIVLISPWNNAKTFVFYTHKYLIFYIYFEIHKAIDIVVRQKVY